jgi:hypothetical protein
VPQQEVLQAMKLARDKDSNSGDLVTEADLVVHLTFTTQCLERPSNLLSGDLKSLQLPFYPGQENLVFEISVLVGMEDVPPVPENEIRNFRHQSFAVWTGD